MRRALKTLVPALLATALVACGGGGGEDKAAPIEDIPLRVGGSWTYQGQAEFGPALNSTVEVVDMSTPSPGVAAFVLRRTGYYPRDDRFEKDSAGIWLVTGDGASAIDQAIGRRLLYKLPLVVGAAWIQAKFTIDLGSLDGSGVSNPVDVDIHTSVEGRENISTPAGDFADAFIVVTSETETFVNSAPFGLSPAVTVTTEWIVPGIGIAKRSSYSMAAGGWRPHLFEESLVSASP